MVADSPTPDAEAISRAVGIFLDRMMSDASLAWTFEGIDAPRVLKHARAFVIAALGGPDLYVGRDMRAVHAPFALRNENFDQAVIHLVASLREVGISQDVISALAARLEPLRRQIVTGP